MKKTLIFVLISIIASFGGKKVRLDIEGAKKDAIGDRQSIQEFIKELSPILDAPMNWCTVEPTGEFQIVNTTRKHTTLRIEVRAECNEFMAKEYVRSLVRRYKPFMIKHESVIRQILLEKYPHLSVTWGTDIHNIENVIINMNEGYGSEVNYQNKVLFFKVVLNESFIAPETARFKMHGNVLTVRDKNEGADIIRKSGWYSYTIHNKTLKNANPTFRLERVYKPKKNQKFITQSNQ